MGDSHDPWKVIEQARDSLAVAADDELLIPKRHRGDYADYQKSPLARIADALEGLLEEICGGQKRLGTPPLDLMADALTQMAADQKRLANHFVPEPEDIVGTNYIAGRLGCTTIWVARMAAGGEIPKRCIVQGTGSGKAWKFHRGHVEDWLATRNSHLTGQ